MDVFFLLSFGVGVVLVQDMFGKLMQLVKEEIKEKNREVC